MSRTYTAAEVDEMRSSLSACEQFRQIGPNGHGTLPSNFDNLIEERLRTYIVAGVDPEELKERADREHDNMQSRQTEIPMLRT